MKYKDLVGEWIRNPESVSKEKLIEVISYCLDDYSNCLSFLFKKNLTENGQETVEKIIMAKAVKVLLDKFEDK